MPCFEPVEVPTIETYHSRELSDSCHPGCHDPCRQVINNNTGIIDGDLPCNVNLLQNPGNEEDLVEGEIPSWSEVVGNSWTQGTQPFGPANNINGFYFWHSLPDDAELHQVISLEGAATHIDTGCAVFEISGWCYSSADTSQILVEFLNDSGEVLDTYEGTIFQNDEWQYETGTFAAPIGSRAARFIIKGITISEAATVNNACFDDLSFVYLCEEDGCEGGGGGGGGATGMCEEDCCDDDLSETQSFPMTLNGNDCIVCETTETHNLDWTPGPIPKYPSSVEFFTSMCQWSVRYTTIGHCPVYLIVLQMSCDEDFTTLDLYILGNPIFVPEFLIYQPNLFELHYQAIVPRGTCNFSGVELAFVGQSSFYDCEITDPPATITLN